MTFENGVDERKMIVPTMYPSASEQGGFEHRLGPTTRLDRGSPFTSASWSCIYRSRSAAGHATLDRWTLWSSTIYRLICLTLEVRRYDRRTTQSCAAFQIYALGHAEQMPEPHPQQLATPIPNIFSKRPTILATPSPSTKPLAIMITRMSFVSVE